MLHGNHLCKRLAWGRPSMLVALNYRWVIIGIRWRIFENGEVYILELVFPVFQFGKQLLRCQESQFWTGFVVRSNSFAARHAVSASEQLSLEAASFCKQGDCPTLRRRVCGRNRSFADNAKHPDHPRQAVEFIEMIAHIASNCRYARRTFNGTATA